MSTPDHDGKSEDWPDPGLAGRVRELQQTVEEIARLAGSPRVQPPPEVPANIRELVRSILRFRANRHSIFGDILFGEPAWDMLLELYEAGFAGRRESVSTLCIASGVPATTALRWIRLLEKNGWIRRVPDPGDGRRFFVELTQTGRDSMNRVFSEVRVPPVS